MLYRLLYITVCYCILLYVLLYKFSANMNRQSRKPKKMQTKLANCLEKRLNSIRRKAKLML